MATKNAPKLRTLNAPAVGDVSELVGKIVSVDPNDIADTQNVRAHQFTDEELNPMRKSLKANGQDQNITVKPRLGATNGEPRFEIIDGRRRLGAAKLERNGNKTLDIKPNENFRIMALVKPVTEGKGNTNSLDTFVNAFRINTENEPMTPLDQAHVYNTLRKQFGQSDPDARKAMSRGGKTFGTGWSNVLSKLVKITQPVRDALEAGDIDANTAADTVGLDDKAVGRVLDAMEKAGTARKRMFEAAKADPSIAEKARAEKEAQLASKKAAREKAQEERRAANAKKREAGAKVRGNANKAPLRTAADIRADFASMVGNDKLPKSFGTFATIMFEYISNRAQFLKVQGAMLMLAGMKPGDVDFTSVVTKGDNTNKGKATTAKPATEKQTVAA